MNPLFLGASLRALCKKTGGLLPIAVGCLFRRMVSKAACGALRERVALLLFPGQLGIGVKDGAVAVAHAARRFIFSSSPQDGILN